MKNLKQIIFIILLSLAFACGGEKSEKTDAEKKDSSETVKNESEKSESKEEKKADSDAKEEVLEGTFAGLEQGDYFYFKVKSENGEEKSLMVLHPDKTYEEIEANPQKFIGKKVKVYWVKSKENIPENGGETEVEKYLRAEVLK